MNLIGRTAIYEGQKRKIEGTTFSKDKRLTRVYFDDWYPIEGVGISILPTRFGRLFGRGMIQFNRKGERIG